MTEASGWNKYANVMPETIVQGEFGVSSDHSAYYSTILGSCIAVCIFDTERCVGGMNHILLPGVENSGGGHDRYGVHLMELVINGVLRLGGQKASMRAKVFGGAKISAHQTTIGEKNASFVKEFLRIEGIPCVSESLGGLKARKVQFVPSSGLARQLFIDPPRELQEREQPKAPAPEVASNITLF